MAIISATLTITLTALNAFWSNQINKIDSDIKVRQAELEKQRLQLDVSKERLARYGFVHSLFDGALDQNVAQKTLTVNLITLALTKEEAEQLFAGLEASPNQQARDVGVLGSDLVALTSLIIQMNDAVKDNRIGAVEKLITNYRANSSAVDQATSMLEVPKLETLSASGLINVLVFLRNTDPSAWTPSTLSRAQTGIALIRQRAAAGATTIGEETRGALSKLEEHLNRIQR
jgi:hypothetical protein